MIVPKSDFRPDPNRAVHIQGEINSALIQRVVPQIISLQYKNRNPITVYIDSHGGVVDQMTTLVEFLKAKSQDGARSCNIVTVVTREAFSAAALLLSTGEYALAYPNSSILYHGGRFMLADYPLTAERSTSFAQVLRRLNERTAIRLSQEIELRFMLRFLVMRGGFEAVRTETHNAHLSDLQCFFVLLERNLSVGAKKILKAAQVRDERYRTLFNYVLNKMRRLSPNKTPLQMEAASLKAIIEFETTSNKNTPGWSFQEDEGINSLFTDFLLFQEYQQILFTARFRNFCTNYSKFLLLPEQKTELDALLDAHVRDQKLIEIVSPILRPVRTFFLALCHTLQRGDDDHLTAADCYWLGLIDEVIGNSDLPPVRLILETQPDPTPEAPPEASE